jgi:hypothetical protein
MCLLVFWAVEKYGEPETCLRNAILRVRVKNGHDLALSRSLPVNGFSRKMKYH